MRRAWVLCAALLAACSSSHVSSEAPRAPGPRKAAVSKLVRAVETAKRPEGQPSAIALLREAVAEDPELWEARYDLGVLLARDGELAAAEEQLAAAFELAPNAEDVACALGEVMRRREEHGRAAAVLSSFVASFPGATSARRRLVAVLREDGQLPKALEHARELLAREPGDGAALSELALTHLAQGEIDVAELLIREAQNSSGKAAVVERAAGLIALARGEDALAFAHFARATELDPADTAAGLETATVLLEAGVYDRAEKHFRVVLELEPRSDAAKLGLAAALRGQGNRDKPAPFRAAETLLREILDAMPEHWAAAHNLAVLYSESLDRPSEATDLYVQFLSHAPSEHPARARAQKWVDDHDPSKAVATPRAEQ